MQKMKKKNVYILSGVIALVIIGLAILLVGQDGSDDSYIIRKGNLETVVNCLGEIKSDKYTEIKVSDKVFDREFRVWNIEVADMVEEGKKVKKGDYIARMNDGTHRSNFQNKMKDKEKIDADLKNAQIDSTVVLTEKRELIANAKLDLEYKKIDLEQSKYESGAYQRKARISYQKTEMQVEKLRRDYLLERNKQKLTVGRLEGKQKEVNRVIAKYQEAFKFMTVHAPHDGIVMFAKDWIGKTLSKGDVVRLWQPLVATLPDMSVVNSEVYIKEIDIAKVHQGDSVKVTIDAIADKTFDGRIIKIANIGETRKGFDMKVFKAIVRLDGMNKDIKPGMTTSNDIILGKYEDRLIIPLSAVYIMDNHTFVYVKEGGEVLKKKIVLEAENDESGVVSKGLKEGDRVLLYQPEEYREESELVNL